MRLPDAARNDLLEFLGATPVADAQLSAVIDSIAERLVRECGGIRMEPS
jgi:hypothetical protein